MRARGPDAEDRVEAVRIVLSGIATGADSDDIAAQLAPLHPRNDTFPGEVLLKLAADAIEEAGAARDRPIDFEGIRERYLRCGAGSMWTAMWTLCGPA